MALKVVGTGLGRTGTKSMQTALGILGFGPCHHMVEVFGHPQSIPLWIEAGKGRPDWDAIFQGYVSVVDYPGAGFWREITAYFPDAKVLHTVRDPDKWFDSTQATIFAPGSTVPEAKEGPMAEFFRGFLGPLMDHLSDRAYMIDHFRRHTEAVKAAIPPERLLVYEAGQGWEPLCAFLDVAVPSVPYPSENSTVDFHARISLEARQVAERMKSGAAS